MSAYDSVIKSRAQGRPTAKKFIENIFTDFFELHGDRLFADDAAVVGGIAKLNGEFVTVIAIEKARILKLKSNITSERRTRRVTARLCAL